MLQLWCLHAVVLDGPLPDIGQIRSCAFIRWIEPRKGWLLGVLLDAYKEKTPGRATIAPFAQGWGSHVIMRMGRVEATTFGTFGAFHGCEASEGPCAGSVREIS